MHKSQMFCQKIKPSKSIDSNDDILHKQILSIIKYHQQQIIPWQAGESCTVLAQKVRFKNCMNFGHVATPPTNRSIRH